LKGHTDIKKVATIEYLRSIILKSDVMLALVTAKASGSDAKNSLVSLNCSVDVSKSFYLHMAEEQKSYSKFYVYHIEGLSVALREYRTIRISEFFGMTPTLIKPSEQPKQPKFDPTEEDKLRMSKMSEFININRNGFNHSQVEVLKTVS
jgi:hypothetical protein